MNKLKEIIEAGEGETLEFKSGFGNEVVETLVAFANSKGGKILVGIANDGSVSGITLSKESVQNWINEIKSKTTPILIPDVEIF